MPPRLPQAPSQNSTIPMVGQAPTKLTLLGRTPCHTQPLPFPPPYHLRNPPETEVIRRCVGGWGCQPTVGLIIIDFVLAARRLAQAGWRVGWVIRVG